MKLRKLPVADALVPVIAVLSPTEGVAAAPDPRLVTPHLLALLPVNLMDWMELQGSRSHSLLLARRK